MQTRLVFQNDVFYLVGLISHDNSEEPFYTAFTRSVGNHWKNIQVIFEKKQVKAQLLNKTPDIYVSVALYVNVKTVEHLQAQRVN